MDLSVLILTFLSFILYVTGGTVKPERATYEAKKGQDVILKWILSPANGEDILRLKIFNGTNDASNQLWQDSGTNKYSSLRDEMFGDRFTAIYDNVNNFVQVTITSLNFNDSSTLLLDGLFFKDAAQKFSEPLSFEVKADKADPDGRGGDDSANSSNNTGIIIGSVIGGIVVLAIIIFIVYYLKCRKTSNKNRKSNDYESSEKEFQYHKQPTHYAKPSDVMPTNKEPEEPKVRSYDELGPGGRMGPRDHVVPSQYAEAKQDDNDSDCDDDDSDSDDDSNDANLVSDSIII